MKKLDQISKKAFHYLFHIVLSLLLLDWAVNLPWSIRGIGLYEIALGLLGCTALIRLFFDKGHIFRSIFQVLRTSKWAVFALSAYLLLNIATLFYAQTPGYALSKYVVVVQMLFLGACFFYYIANHGAGCRAALQRIYLNMGLSAVIAAIWALMNYLFCSGGSYSTVITPIADYNQYSTILLVGWICGILFASQFSVSVVKKYAIIAVFSGILLPMILVSSSRRSFLLALVIAAATLILAVCLGFCALRKNSTRQMRLRIGCTLLVCVLCVSLTTVLLPKATDALSHLPDSSTSTPGKPSTNVPQTPKPPSANSAQDRLLKDGGFGKRKLIWAAGLEEFSKFDIPALLFGKGASYDSDFYNDFLNPSVLKVWHSYGYNYAYQAPDHWMNSHNLFLQDMLNGGILLLLSQLSVFLATAVYIFRILRRNPVGGIALGLLSGILLITLFLSPSRGVLANKFFWLISMFQMAEFYRLKTTDKQ